MASFQWRTNGDGSRRVTALVRVRGMKPASKTFADEGEARSWASEMESRLRTMRNRASARPDIARVTVRELCERYLDDPATKALRSYDDVALFLAWWIDRYGSSKTIEFGATTIFEARSQLMPGRSHATVNRYIAPMRQAFSWGRRVGLVPEDRPWPSGVMLPEPRGRTRFLSDEEMDRLFTALDSHPSWLRLAIVVSIGTGIRMGELLWLTWRYVDLERARITLMETKTDRPRSVHLTDAVIEELKHHGPKAPDEKVIPASRSYLNKHWRKVRQEAKLDNFRWHDARHTAASLLAQGGASLPEIGSVLGHRSAASTARYAHLVEGEPLRAHAKIDAKLRGRR